MFFVLSAGLGLGVAARRSSRNQHLIPTVSYECFPKIGVPPKWMVKIVENPIKMDDLGVYTTIFGNIHIFCLVARNFAIHPRSLTASFPLKNGGWKTNLSYWGLLTLQGRTVKLREGNSNPQKYC